MRLSILLPLLAGILLGCGRKSGTTHGMPEAEKGAPFRGVGHGTGEPGSGYGGQERGKGNANPAPDTPGAAHGPDRATRPGAGNAEAR